MDPLFNKLITGLQDLVMPYDRILVLDTLTIFLAGTAISWLSDHGVMHDASKVKELLLSQFGRTIDVAIQKAHDDTFRRN